MCLKTEGWKYDQKYRTIKKTNTESDYKKEKKKKQIELLETKNCNTKM